MSSLATHTLYAGLNDEAMVWERAFVDPARETSRSGRVCSLESGALLRDFDVVAVTSSFELDWPALPGALAAGGVPPLRADRHSGPLVIAGARPSPPPPCLSRTSTTPPHRRDRARAPGSERGPASR